MASPDKPRRPWYRPHLSTWVAIALVSLLFGLWNVAGYYREYEPFHEDCAWVYGWPATYLKQTAEFEGFPYSRRVDDSLVLNLWKPASEFHVLALCLNVGAGLAICLCFGVGFEFWRRRRAHLFQIYLSELGLLTLCVAGILGCGRYLILTAHANRAAMEESGESLNYRTESLLPEWIHQRLENRHYYRWHWDDVVVEIHINKSIDAGQMQTIGRQRGLRKMEVSCPLPSQVWQSVANCQRLEELSVSPDSLHDDDLEVLAQLPQLRKLELSMGRLTDDSFRHVGKIKSLRELSLGEDFPGLIGEGLEHLAVLPLAEVDLHFDRSKCSECDLTPLSSLQQLRTLRIQNKPLTNRDVSALRDLSNLDSLYLFECEFENAREGAILFRDLTKLRKLIIGANSIPPEIGEAISDLRGLEELRVHGSEFFDDDVTWISQIPSLRRLAHFGNHISSAGIARLTQLRQLEELEFYSDDVKDDAIDSFVQMKALKSLKLTCDHLSQVGMARLKRERPDLNVIYGMCY